MNHVLQGDIKTAIESHRRQMPYNMGTLFWQHNDCWPVASWASRDYYGRWKAQHYYTRKVYDDILISPVVEGDLTYMQSRPLGEYFRPAAAPGLPVRRHRGLSLGQICRHFR